MQIFFCMTNLFKAFDLQLRVPKKYFLSPISVQQSPKGYRQPCIFINIIRT